jgi:hypothetical protein
MEFELPSRSFMKEGQSCVREETIAGKNVTDFCVIPGDVKGSLKSAYVCVNRPTLIRTTNLCYAKTESKLNYIQISGSYCVVNTLHLSSYTEVIIFYIQI